MKRQVLKTMLGLTVIAALGMTGPIVSASESETETETAIVLEGSAVIEGEAVPEAAETEAAPDVEIPDSVTLKNESGYVVKEAVLKAASQKDETEAETESAFEKTLVLTGEDGKEHTFEQVDFSAMTDPVLISDNGFLYIRYTNEEGEEKEAAETAEEVEFEKELTMYVTNDVYIRAEGNGDSEALGVASLGNEITVTGASPKWYKVKQGDVTGYVARAFLSKDKESADAAVKAEEAAVAQAQAQAAAAAAAQAAQQSGGQTQQSGAQSVYEVSREKYDDCDGSGHGYYEITYSDGSTVIEEY